nr:unnamed protein product [Callosobruchus chinensis]
MEILNNFDLTVHQQALCGKVLNLNDINVNNVYVNNIEAQTLQRNKLLFHSEVRWLSRRRVLKRFNNILSSKVECFKQHDGTVPKLENTIWLRDFGFLVYTTEKLNQL